MPTYMGTMSHKTQAKPLKVSCSSGYDRYDLPPADITQDELSLRFKAVQRTIGSSKLHNTYM
ncbi:hypothetical protein F4776DRAFT_623964 [Hypoxylon sp. NC0597]|nr:hypothetical protein F4776DRAFT_623964 [Hypoxylon sp. NC0597]